MKFILEYARRPDDDNGGNGVCSFIAKREGEATVHAGRERPPLHHHPYPYHRLLFADAAAVG